MAALLLRPRVAASAALAIGLLRCRTQATAAQPTSSATPLTTSLPAHAVDAALNELYAGLEDGHDVPVEELRAIDESGGHEAYGELTCAGVRDVIHRLCAQPGDVLADLGSGCGRMALQCALEWPLMRAVGVELSHTRHHVAEQALVRCKEQLGAHVAERVRLYEADMLAPELTAQIEDVTLVYVASLLFDDEFMQRLGGMLAARSRLRAIATLSRFPAGSLPGFEEHESNHSPDAEVLDQRVEVTWGAARVFIYVRSRADAGTKPNAHLPT